MFDRGTTGLFLRFVVIAGLIVAAGSPTIAAPEIGIAVDLVTIDLETWSHLLGAVFAPTAVIATDPWQPAQTTESLNLLAPTASSPSTTAPEATTMSSAGTVGDGLSGAPRSGGTGDEVSGPWPKL